MARFSEKCISIDKNSIGALARELDSLTNFFAGGTYTLIQLGTGRIGVCVDIDSRANSRSFLRRTEPVVIVLNIKNWETTPPIVFPDRSDFPYKQFPHVFYEGREFPAGLCLTRENLYDWYSEHTLRDYVIRLNEWMQDAARKNLIKVEMRDEFEPQRYMGKAIETTFYRLFYNDCMLEQQSAPSSKYFSLNVHSEISIAFGTDEFLSQDDNAIGVRLYRGNNGIDDEWIANYPRQLGILYEFIERKGYPFNKQEFMSLMEGKDYAYFMLALLRPTRIIDKDSRINYLCFRAKSSDVLNDVREAHIEEVMIKDYPNLDTARRLSQTPGSIAEKRFVILGCGALGSKVALHLFRSGVDHLTLVDNDNLEPHNMCRHALLCTPLFETTNKAELLKKAMNNMFLGVPDHIEAHTTDALSFLNSTDLSKFDIIIDATASAAVLHGLDTITFPVNTKVVRLGLSEGGSIGISYINTGSKRLLSDYYAEILRQAIRDDDISNWLKQEKKNSLEDIRIGEGCHSNTMRISDDTISAHAASMSSVIRHIFEPPLHDGFMISIADDIFPGSMVTNWYDAPEFTEFHCENDKAWRVRIANQILIEIRTQTRIHGRNETGGYMYGHVDYKRNLIYVLSQFIPSDSKHDISRLGLSKKGFKAFDKLVEDRTAHQLYYLGDWHSHPSAPLTMSELDVDTCRRDILPAMYNKIGICVITNSVGIAAFLVSEKL